MADVLVIENINAMVDDENDAVSNTKDEDKRKVRIKMETDESHELRDGEYSEKKTEKTEEVEPVVSQKHEDSNQKRLEQIPDEMEVNIRLVF